MQPPNPPNHYKNKGFSKAKNIFVKQDHSRETAILGHKQKQNPKY